MTREPFDPREDREGPPWILILISAAIVAAGVGLSHGLFA